MSNIYATSDHHFFHSKIIEYCNRPYSSVDEMNEDLVKRWNETVSPDDTVYHLGDFCLASLERQQEIFNRLNGEKILILGNHDGSASRMKKVGFADTCNNLSIGHLGQTVFMTHKPEDAGRALLWRKNFTILYGHCHNTKSIYDTMDGWVNCCVENWDYRPVLLETLIEKGMNTKND